MERMLNLDPKKRETAESLLRHEYFDELGADIKEKIGILDEIDSRECNLFLE